MISRLTAAQALVAFLKQQDVQPDGMTQPRLRQRRRRERGPLLAQRQYGRCFDCRRFFRQRRQSENGCGTRPDRGRFFRGPGQGRSESCTMVIVVKVDLDQRIPGWGLWAARSAYTAAQEKEAYFLYQAERSIDQ